MDAKINKLIDIYLEGNVTLEEYKHKKGTLINKKKDLQEKLRDFADRDNNWFEPAKEFVTLLNRAGCEAREGNLESQKEFLEKIGSNFILKERRLIFSSEGTLRHYLSNAPYSDWRRGRDSNPRSAIKHFPVFKTGPFNRSGTSPCNSLNMGLFWPFRGLAMTKLH